MADLGFLPAVRRLLEATPANAQRLLFSATLDAGVDVLVRRFMTAPVTHSVDSAQSPVSKMTHHVLHVQADSRLPGAGRPDRGSRPHAGLHPHQVRRQVAHQEADRAGRARRSSCTATCPRVPAPGTWRPSPTVRPRRWSPPTSRPAGIHVDDVTLVIHADPPIEHKAYLHRSGRTARAGAEGTVVTLMTDDQVRDVRDLTRKAGIAPTVTKLRVGDPLLAELAPGERTFVEPTVKAVTETTGTPYGGESAGRGRGGRARGRRSAAGPGAVPLRRRPWRRDSGAAPWRPLRRWRPGGASGGKRTAGGARGGAAGRRVPAARRRATAPRLRARALVRREPRPSRPAPARAAVVAVADLDNNPMDRAQDAHGRPGPCRVLRGERWPSYGPCWVTLPPRSSASATLTTTCSSAASLLPGQELDDYDAAVRRRRCTPRLVAGRSSSGPARAGPPSRPGCRGCPSETGRQPVVRRDRTAPGRALRRRCRRPVGPGRAVRPRAHRGHRRQRGARRTDQDRRRGFHGLDEHTPGSWTRPPRRSERPARRSASTTSSAPERTPYWTASKDTGSRRTGSCSGI